MTWDARFLDIFDRCLEKHRAGQDFPEGYYTPEELAFLSSIGYKPRELYDFVEDLADEGQPSLGTALLIAAVRRDYFLVVQEGQPSEKEYTAQDLPTFGDEAEGLRYLPRIIAKAQHKLRGELDPDVMFGCGGDRNFLQKNGDIHPADFLRHVWAAEGEVAKVAAFVKSHQ